MKTRTPIKSKKATKIVFYFVTRQKFIFILHIMSCFKNTKYERIGWFEREREKMRRSLGKMIRKEAAALGLYRVIL